MDTISNFFILPVSVPAYTSLPTSTTPAPSKKSKQSPATSSPKTVLHYLYIKKHESPKVDRNTPKDRTLFVLNVPVDATESHFRDLFKPYGRVASVQIINRVKESGLSKEEREEQEELERKEKELAAALKAQEKAAKNKKSKKGSKQVEEEDEMEQDTVESKTRPTLATGSQAFVVFLEEQELTKVLAMKKKQRTWIATGKDATQADTNKLSSLGVSKWMLEYYIRRPAQADLQAKVDDYMEKFERSEYEAQQAALARLNVMDDDGFTLVTRAGSKGQNSDGVITIQAVKAEDAKKLKPKNKELQDFYRFQMREAKRDKLVDLRRKFEEDKLKIEALKVNRRFRPY